LLRSVWRQGEELVSTVPHTTVIPDEAVPLSLVEGLADGRGDSNHEEPTDGARITINEPYVVTIPGWFNGDCAPGRSSKRPYSAAGDSETEPWM
jgi:hypothetical protein